MMGTITVSKRDIHNHETWRYQGKILEQFPHVLTLQAFFDRDDVNFHGMPLMRGDRFIETYYDDRWFNIFEIHAREDDHLRGWYCNIAMPAQLEDGILSFVDLALDLLVFPDGRQLVLDEDEFAELALPEELHSTALAALDQLRSIFQQSIEQAAQAGGNIPRYSSSISPPYSHIQ